MQISCSSIDKTFVLPKQSKTSCQTLKWMRIPPNFTFKPYITGSDAESFRTMLDFPLSRHVKWSLHLIPLPPPSKPCASHIRNKFLKIDCEHSARLNNNCNCNTHKKACKNKENKILMQRLSIDSDLLYFEKDIWEEARSDSKVHATVDLPILITSAPNGCVNDSP